MNIFTQVMSAHSFKSYVVPKAWFEKQHSPPSPSPHFLFSISQGDSLNWLAGRWSFMPPGYMLLSPHLKFSLSIVSIGFSFWRLKIEFFFMSSPHFPYHVHAHILSSHPEKHSHSVTGQINIQSLHDHYKVMLAQLFVLSGGKNGFCLFVFLVGFIF